jgi:hypothetical protein
MNIREVLVEWIWSSLVIRHRQAVDTDKNKSWSGLTGASIQARNCVSRAWQPAMLWPADAQHAVRVSNEVHRWQGAGTCTEHGRHDCQTRIGIRLSCPANFEPWEGRQPHGLQLCGGSFGRHLDLASIAKKVSWRVCDQFRAEVCLKFDGFNILRAISDQG